MTEFEHVTTRATVEIYNASSGVFESLLAEVKELSRKKPEATMSAGKVKIINRVLEDLLIFLKDEPAGKYLDPLDDETLPQMSDAVLVMVQFESALRSFRGRYQKHLHGAKIWITEEWLAERDEDDEYEDFE
jgi:hypothetical protein